MLPRRGDAGPGAAALDAESSVHSEPAASWRDASRTSPAAQLLEEQNAAWAAAPMPSPRFSDSESPRFDTDAAAPGAHARAASLKRHTYSRLLADPRMPAVRRWDVLILLWLLFTASLSPFEVAFMSGFGLEEPPESTAIDERFALALFVLNRVCDLTFVADVVLQFNLIYVDTVTQRAERSRGVIARNYLRGAFAVDIISTIPFDLVASLAQAANPGGNHAVLRAMRALRVRGVSCARGAA